MWIIDSMGETEKEAALYELPFTHALRHGCPERGEKQTNVRVCINWWRHVEADLRMWRARANQHYIATPTVLDIVIFAHYH
jgi:hypothetical protein